MIQENLLDSVELTDRQVRQADQDHARGRPATATIPLRGLVFTALLRKMPPLGLVDALSRGWEETVDNISNVFRCSGGWPGRIGGDAVGGVIPIAQIAYSAASMRVDVVHPASSEC